MEESVHCIKATTTNNTSSRWSFGGPGIKWVVSLLAVHMKYAPTILCQSFHIEVGQCFGDKFYLRPVGCLLPPAIKQLRQI